jgi:hypothetical protein
MKLNFILIFFPFFFFVVEVYSQVDESKTETEIKKRKFEDNTNISLNEVILFDIPNLDSLQTNVDKNPLLDSLKYIYELKLLCKMDLKTVKGLDISNEIYERDKQRDLVFQSLREYYRDQPKADLGKLSKILGISQKVLALMFGIIML